MIGEMGNDILRGGAGDDTCVFNLGVGQDVIEDGSGRSVIVFREEIEEKDICVARNWWNLYLNNMESGDRVTVKYFFNNDSCFIENVEFVDGSIRNIDALKDKARYYYGS